MSKIQSALSWRAQNGENIVDASIVAHFIEQQMKIAPMNGVRTVRARRDGKRGFEVLFQDAGKTKPVRGVINAISQRFGSEQMNAILASKRGAKVASRCKSSSSIGAGLLVHRHLHHIVECKKGSCDCDVKTKGRNLSAEMVVRWLNSKGWKPCMSERGVYCEDLMLATQFDLLCVTDDLQLVLVSIKTGYPNIAQEEKRFRLQHPLDYLDDTQLVRHQLQVILEREMLQRAFSLHIDQLGVLYVNYSDKELVIEFYSPQSAHLPLSEQIGHQMWDALTLRDPKPVVRSEYWRTASHSNSETVGGPSEHTLDRLLVEGQ